MRFRISPRVERCYPKMFRIHDIPVCIFSVFRPTSSTGLKAMTREISYALTADLQLCAEHIERKLRRLYVDLACPSLGSRTRTGVYVRGYTYHCDSGSVWDIWHQIGPQFLLNQMVEVQILTQYT